MSLYTFLFSFLSFLFAVQSLSFLYRAVLSLNGSNYKMSYTIVIEF